MNDKHYCAICGKEIEALTSEGKPRRNAKYCSAECRRKARALYTKKYIKKRYDTDEEFRKHRTASTSRLAKMKRDKAKADAIIKVAQRVRDFDTEEQAIEYLTKTVKVRSEYAYGSKTL